MRDTHEGTLGGRCLLVLLALYALALIVPDLGRIARPLGSFGLAADGDGVIYDVRGAFPDDSSPAFRAGIRPGDRLDLAAMRCMPVETDVCASMLALWGGLNYATPGHRATLVLAAPEGQAPRKVVLVARNGRPAFGSISCWFSTSWPASWSCSAVPGWCGCGRAA
jgi:hypothetical protein